VLDIVLADDEVELVRDAGNNILVVVVQGLRFRMLLEDRIVEVVRTQIDVLAPVEWILLMLYVVALVVLLL